jgi:hypothetical protein
MVTPGPSVRLPLTSVMPPPEVGLSLFGATASL